MHLVSSVVLDRVSVSVNVQYIFWRISRLKNIVQCASYKGTVLTICCHNLPPESCLLFLPSCFLSPVPVSSMLPALVSCLLFAVSCSSLMFWSYFPCLFSVFCFLSSFSCPYFLHLFLSGVSCFLSSVFCLLFLVSCFLTTVPVSCFLSHISCLPSCFLSYTHIPGSFTLSLFFYSLSWLITLSHFFTPSPSPIPLSVPPFLLHFCVYFSFPSPISRY
jgi:hypothetical protein